MDRKKEFILTLIAGIIGVLVAGLGIVIGSFFTFALETNDLKAAAVDGAADAELLSSQSSTLIVLAVITLVIAIALFALAFFIKRNPRVFGIIILILATLGFFLLKFLWIIPGLLAVIAGVLCLKSKTQDNDFR